VGSDKSGIGFIKYPGTVLRAGTVFRVRIEGYF